MEPVKICHFKTFLVGIRIFFTIYMLKSLFCEVISVEYEFNSVKFKGGIDRLKNE